MLLLPFWKFAAKKYVARSIHEMEDYVPGIVTFTVDYFSTLFISVSMYNSGAILVSVLAVLSDAASLLLSIESFARTLMFSTL